MKNSAGRKASLTLLWAGTLAAALGWLAGCRPAQKQGKLSDLFISNRRYCIQDKKDPIQVQVFGRLENTGQSKFKQVEVLARVRSANGDVKGENSVVLDQIEPGEKRNFSLTVTSHSRVSDVVLQVKRPQGT